MPFQIIRNDITKVKADAIVNSANPQPKYASGTDAAVYQAAGADKLLTERKKIGVIPCGEVAVTPAFRLKAKYIIHTVAPAWEGGNKGELEALRNCYSKSLVKATELGCKSIAFPLIATGIYRFPKAEALQIAVNEISSFLMKDDVDMSVKLVVFDDKAFRLSKNLFFQVESFINDEDVIAAHRKEYGVSARDLELERREYLRENDFIWYSERPEPILGSVYPPTTGPKPNADSGNRKPRKILYPGSSFDEKTFDKEQFMRDDGEEDAFREHLMQLLIEKGIDNNVVYKRSNVSKGAFSKILCGDTKKPQKKTVLGLCIGLQLTLEESENLLASADMAFNPYNKRDKLVIQCIEHEQYDIYTINMMLYLCKQPLLGNE